MCETKKTTTKTIYYKLRHWLLLIQCRWTKHEKNCRKTTHHTYIQREAHSLPINLKCWHWKRAKAWICLANWDAIECRTITTGIIIILIKSVKLKLCLYKISALEQCCIRCTEPARVRRNGEKIKHKRKCYFLDDFMQCCRYANKRFE